MTTWQLVGERLYTRPLGEHEIFIKILDDTGLSLGREQWSITCSAKVRSKGRLGSSNLASSLRKVWINLRHEHPGIAVQAMEREFQYQVPDKQAVQDWAERTFIIDDEATSVTDIIATLT